MRAPPDHPRYAWMNAITSPDATIGAGCRLVLLVIGHRFLNEKGEAWPSQATLAKHSGLTDRTVRNAIDEAVTAGFLERWAVGRNHRYRVRTPENFSGIGLGTTPEEKAATPENSSSDTGKFCSEHRQILPTIFVGNFVENFVEPPKSGGDVQTPDVQGLSPTAWAKLVDHLGASLSPDPAARKQLASDLATHGAQQEQEVLRLMAAGHRRVYPKRSLPALAGMAPDGESWDQLIEDARAVGLGEMFDGPPATVATLTKQSVRRLIEKRRLARAGAAA